MAGNTTLTEASGPLDIRKKDLPVDFPTPEVVKFAKRGQLAKLIEVLNRGDNVNGVDKHKRSALFCAALNGNKKCLKELLRRGGNPNQRNLNGQTPCHAAVLGGRSPHFPDDTISTRNPVTGTCRVAVGCYNYISYYFHDAKTQCRCLQYLLKFGGDLKAQSLTGETAKDIAVRMRKMDILELIEHYFQLQATVSGNNIASGVSMLRPNGSYPHSCPHWMHTDGRSTTTLENTSPLTSKASLFYKGRCRDIYDYGFVFPLGSRISPGTFGAVPEILPSEVLKISSTFQKRTIDGSAWSRATWSGGVSVTLRQMDSTVQSNINPVLNVENLMKEMDNLSVFRHPNISLLMAVCCGPTKKDMFLAMEPLQPCSLHQLLHKEHKVFAELEMAEIMVRVTSAVAYLHTVKGVAHNILSSHAVYLTPTGTAKLCNVFCCHSPSDDDQLPGELSSALRLYLPWMSAELMHTRIPNFASDIYSLGVVLWELWGGEQPWPGLTPPEIGRVLVKEGQRLTISKKHQDIAPILKCCFCSPIGRLTVEQFLSQVEYLKRAPRERKNSNWKTV